MIVITSGGRSLRRGGSLNTVLNGINVVGVVLASLQVACSPSITRFSTNLAVLVYLPVRALKPRLSLPTLLGAIEICMTDVRTCARFDPPACPVPPPTALCSALLRMSPSLPFVGSDFASMLLEHPDEGGSVLTKQSLDVFWSLNALIVEREVSPFLHSYLRVNGFDNQPVGVRRVYV